MATPEGTTPMHAANTVPIATALLQRGANMHAVNNVRAKSYLMLPYTVKKGSLNPIFFLFFQEGNTPLHERMSEEGAIEVVRMLLDHGASLSALNEEGRTPLHLAAGFGRRDLLLCLVERGGDINIRDDVKSPHFLPSFRLFVIIHL